MASINPKEVLAKARELEKAGKMREASGLYSSIGVYLRKKKKYAKARPFLERAISLSPKSARLHLQLAVVEALTGNMEEAETAMDRFSRYTIRKERVSEYLPYLESNLQNLPALRKIFYEHLLRLDRTEADPFIRHAEASEQEQDYLGAKKMLLAALKAGTHREQVVAVLGRVLGRLGQAKMIGSLDRFKANKLSLEDLLVLLKDPKKKAGAESESAAPITREDMPEEKELPDLIRELEEEMGIELEDKHDKVRPLIDEFRRRSKSVIGEDNQTRLDMAMAFFEMGLYGDARDEVGMIDPMDPLFPQSRLFLAQVQLAEGGELSALETLQDCLRDERFSPEERVEARYRLVLVYHKLGDVAQAWKTVQKLYEDAPEYRDVRQMKNQLQDRVKGSKTTR